MKICPSCGKTYPDDERFCDTDGTALVAAASGARQTAAMPPDPVAGSGASGAIECPECGGKAEPGETICNFCGTRLLPDTAGGGPAGATVFGAGAAQGRRLNPEDYRPADDRDQSFGAGPTYGASNPEAYPEYSEEPEKRGFLGALGYVIAALIALAAGASLALYLSLRHAAPPPIAQTSPSPSPSVSEAATGPSVDLARNMQIQIKGPDLAAALQRDPASARTVFENNKEGLLDTYKQALGGDSSLHDGMVVRLHVNPDGTVAGGGVVVSTATNPSLDAEVVSTMSAWKFAPVSGGPVDIDYPVIFAANPGDMAGIESDLNTRLASAGPGVTPEYTSSPPAIATPAVAMAEPSPPAVAPPPPPEMAPPPVTPSRPRHRHGHRPPTAKMPAPSLTERVMDELRASRRTRRVQVYASPGGMVTLSGSVFGEKDKAYAERTVRNVSGVTGIIDNLNVQTAEWVANQNRIQQELQNAGLTGVTVKVIGKDAYLDGEVKTALDKQRAVTITMSAAPVNVAGNLIRVAPGRVFGF
ncbi:MAG: TonB family protein [Candidatus Binataceae bacterium]|jgi:TonB family protein